MATTIKKSKDRAPGAKDISEVKYQGSTALYGPSGTGKTTLASTYPKPMLYFNILDNGTDSISDVEGIDVVDITTAEELREQVLWCVKQANKGKLMYKTIVTDTLTQLQGILVKEMGEKKKLKASGKRAGDFGTLTKQDWGQIAGELKDFIMDIRNIDGVESVFICQQRIFNMPDDEESDGLDQLAPEVGPKLMPSVNKDLCASVSTIGHTFIRLKVTKEKTKGKILRKTEKQFCLRVGPNEVYTTKVRKPKGVEAPDFIVDPSFRKLQKLKKGKE